MKEENEDLSYLSLFITEPVYVFDEAEPEVPAPAREEVPAKQAEAPVEAPVVKEQPAKIAPTPEPVVEKASKVAAEAPSTKKEPALPAMASYTGDNDKNILVAVEGSPSPAEKDLLIKILSAVSLSMSDVALTNVQGVDDPVALPHHDLLISFGSKNPVLFGGDIPSPYTVVTRGGKKLMLSNSLTRLNKEVEAKKKLWGTLKKLFVA